MNRLKLLREEFNMSQEQAGNVIGVSSQAFGLYEKEKRDLSPEKIIKLSEYFGVSTDYLLGKSDIRNPQTEFDADLIKIGLSIKDYYPPTENQKKQIEEFAKLVLEENKKNLRRTTKENGIK
ncbi:MAG: helix-turn-helix transcriptional regulator [Clostridia bacterium]|nr:helix-turn-helix transcriptional regulator [Clostridia bacterium]